MCAVFYLAVFHIASIAVCIYMLLQNGKILQKHLTYVRRCDILKITTGEIDWFWGESNGLSFLSHGCGHMYEHNTDISERSFTIIGSVSCMPVYTGVIICATYQMSASTQTTYNTYVASGNIVARQ